MDVAIELLRELFLRSPSLGVTVILAVWLSRAWWFRLVDVGRKRSFPLELLSACKVGNETTGECQLDHLAQRPVQLSGGKELQEQWRVLEVYGVFWTLQARAWVVKLTTGALLFVLFSLAVMYLAGPAENVSLTPVAKTLGLFSILGLAGLISLSAAMVMLSGHTLIQGVLKDAKRPVVLLSSW